MNATPETITMQIGAAQVTVPKDAAVRAFLDGLLNGHSAPQVVVFAPRIGESWPQQGGIYAGVARGQNGEPDYHLIVAEPEQSSINWGDAVRWADGLQLHSFSDFTLPKRHEQALLYGNVPELFAKEWYWSGEQHASDSDYAWVQDFGNGDQDDGHKGTSYRARAVRRVVIQ